MVYASNTLYVLCPAVRRFTIANTRVLYNNNMYTRMVLERRALLISCYT